MLGKTVVEFKFFGHNLDPSINADKIWGWCTVNGRLYNFWGRRGDEASMKKLKFKLNEETYYGNSLISLARAKERKGYKSIALTQDADGIYTEVEKIYPGFTKHIRSQLMFERLSGKVLGEREEDY